jgi:hypothetical protein
MAESKIGDITTRLAFYTEGDALDFQKTGRAVLVVEDGGRRASSACRKAG